MTKRNRIADQLRDRILKGLDTGALQVGDRLPSSREFALEFGADPRVITAAYRQLSAEALVEIRPKSGVYLSANALQKADKPFVPVNWLADTFVEAVRRGMPLSELGSSVFDFAETRRIKAVSVADTLDQAIGIGAELKREYGLVAAPHHLADLGSSRLPPKVTSAQVFFAANDCALEVRRVARELRRPMVAICARTDLFDDAEWQALKGRDVYVIATDPAFVTKLRAWLQHTGAPAKLRMMIAGQDDLSLIPPEAPTYVTESARAVIGKTRLPGRVIKSRRLFSDATVRDVVSFIIAHNSTAA